MLAALGQGLKATARSWGLVALLLAVNVAVAALLAVPLAVTLETDLAKTDSASGMLYGADYPWWSRWLDSHGGYEASFSPDILGAGFAFKNVDLLLEGWLPASLLVASDRDAAEAEANPGPGALILGVGVLYLLVQTFLLGGVLGVFRGQQGSWTARGLLHGSGFYFGRLFRVALIALAVDWILFLLNAPLARWADKRALEAVSETTALAWSFSRHALLLLAVLCVNMISCYAKVIVVLEERSSAVLAFLSSLAFCLGNLARTLGHYLAVALLGVLLLGAFVTIEGLFITTGYKTQLVALALAQGLVFGRIGLRLALLAGQMALYRGATRDA
jgi:hypothetical protein